MSERTKEVLLFIGAVLFSVAIYINLNLLTMSERTKEVLLFIGAVLFSVAITIMWITIGAIL